MDNRLVIFNGAAALAACRGNVSLAHTLMMEYRRRLTDEWEALALIYATTPPDWVALRKQAHGLQSSSAYLGAERIAAAARDLEASILAQASVENLAAAWETLRHAIQEFLAIPPQDEAFQLGG